MSFLSSSGEASLGPRKNGGVCNLAAMALQAFAVLRARLFTGVRIYGRPSVRTPVFDIKLMIMYCIGI